jgi:hypothetical protein
MYHRQGYHILITQNKFVQPEDIIDYTFKAEARLDNI